MIQVNHFAVSTHWQCVLQDLKFVVRDVLEAARLPSDLFLKPDQQLMPHEYFRLWRSMEKLASEPSFNNRPLPLMVGEVISTECFDVPIFASLCSPDFNMALKRLSHYKPLIGPMRLHIQQTPIFTGLSVSLYNCDEPMPDVLQAFEMVFFTQLLRIATREFIVPLSVSLPHIPKQDVGAYQQFFGCEFIEGKCVEIRFAAADASKPFLTHNSGMWDFFEDSLNRRLILLNGKNSTQSKVKTALLRALPAGEICVDKIAETLAMSQPILQQKLAAEGVQFQELLDNVRLELADHYLKMSHIPLREVAFLLGYQESHVFDRAYSAWKGMAPLAFREQFLG